MRLGSRFILAKLLSCLVWVAAGEVKRWLKLRFIRRRPNILYIATNDYIYKSRDEGQDLAKHVRRHDPFPGNCPGHRSPISREYCSRD